jgi:hypothetical protein
MPSSTRELKNLAWSWKSVEERTKGGDGTKAGPASQPVVAEKIPLESATVGPLMVRKAIGAMQTDSYLIERVHLAC